MAKNLLNPRVKIDEPPDAPRLHLGSWQNTYRDWAGGSDVEEDTAAFL